MKRAALQKLKDNGSYRWVVVVLLFFATTINYLDRQVIGLLKPVLEQKFQWSETDFSKMVMAFSFTYAIGLLLFGRWIDKIGTRKGYIVSVIVWSAAAMVHAFVSTTGGFMVARGLLGIGEAGNFPAAIKTVAEWFPRRERALATGLFNSGASVGAVLAPVIVPLLLASFGWQWAFIVTGALGFIWLIFWWNLYSLPAQTAGVSTAELAYINSDEEELNPQQKVSWASLFKMRETWVFITGKFLADPIWWFFLFWMPSFFASRFALNLSKPSLHLVMVYAATTLGSIGGGYLSSYMIKKGKTPVKARKLSLLIAAVCVVPVTIASYVDNIWIAVLVISLAAAAHNAWSANIFTLASDMFPKHSLSSVIGIGGMAGSVGGILFPLVTGLLLDHYKNQGNIIPGYQSLFIFCGMVYVLAWIIIHFLIPAKYKKQ